MNILSPNIPKKIIFIKTAITSPNTVKNCPSVANESKPKNKVVRATSSAKNVISLISVVKYGFATAKK